VSLGEALPNNKVSLNRLNILADAAAMYYLKGQSQSQIAKNLDVSRSMVSRMLTDARRLGLVRIHIEHPVNHNTELEKLLCQQFGLQTAIVVEQPGGQALLTSLGKAAARYLEEELKPGQTLGTSWGTAISATVVELQFETPIPGIRIVQLLGSLGDGIKQYHGISIVNRLVDKLGGEGIYLNAPYLVESARLASVLKENKDILETFQLGSQADLALLGIGSAEPKVSPYVLAGYLPEEEMEDIYDNGAIGDVSGNFFDINGDPLHSELQERTIGISLEDLGNIPLRIGVSGGPHKIDPIIGAIRGKHVNVLVTDANTAQGVINRTKE
jgi:DNA-binding transcriptional regulator LsrR (DeoR family)